MTHAMTIALHMGYTGSTLRIYLLPPGGLKVCTVTSLLRCARGLDKGDLA